MFDLDVVIPVCGKFRQRIEDFKRYGLVNHKGRSVRVNLVVSDEKVEGLEVGWGGNFTVRVVENDSPEYVANLYRFYLSINPSAPESRWLVRLDDDSCTDVDGLLSNLDKFYGHEAPFYLGDLHPLQNALNGYEGQVYQQYKSFLGDYERFGHLMRSEVECGVMSMGAMSKVMSNPDSKRLIERRASLQGGYGDCVVALASAMAGVYPIDCPFITHQPLLHEFSLFGGVRNHVHMISRLSEGENFWNRASMESFFLLTKVVDNSPTDIESRLFGKRMLLENDSAVRIFEFRANYTARVKPDNKQINWYEQDGSVIILDAGSVTNRIRAEGDSFVCDDFKVSFL